MPSLYFKQRLFEEDTLRRILLVGCIILCVMSIVDWTFAGLFGAYGRAIKVYLRQLIGDIIGQPIDFQAVMVPPMVYLSMIGCFQVIINIIYGLALYQKIGLTHQNRWVRVIIALMIFEFGFNFHRAVWCSMSTTYYNSQFKDYFEMTEDFIAQQIQSYRNVIRIAISIYRLCVAATVLTWLFSIPIVIIKIFCLFDRLLVENVEALPIVDMNSQNELEESKPNSIQEGNSKFALPKIDIKPKVDE